MQYLQKNRKTVFTLVELIIVIAIIAILSVAAFLYLTKWIAKSRDSRRMSDVYTIQTALNVYHYSKSVYPQPGNAVNIYDSEGEFGQGTGYVIGVQGVFDESSIAGVDTLSSLPKDPSDGSYYTYTLLNVGDGGIEIGTTLEQPTLSYINQNVYASDVSTRQPYMTDLYNDSVMNYMDLPYLTMYSSDIGYLNQSNLGSGGAISLRPSSKTILAINGTYTNTGTIQFLDNVITTEKPFWTVHKVVAGGAHVCALSYSGVVSCWGSNFAGQLGDNTLTDRKNIVAITGLLFKDINTSVRTTCGITKDGAGMCWGRNAFGEVGNNTVSSAVIYPQYIQGGIKFQDIQPGQRHTCGLSTEGKVYCWGTGINGELGNGAVAQSNIPVLISGEYTFKSISLSQSHTCGLTTDGKIYCWGLNNTGQLGNNSTTNSDVPVLVQGGLTFMSVSAGAWTTCGLTLTGKAYCWGRNNYGTLGDGTNINSNLPVAVTGGISFKVISSFTTMCGISFDGKVYCWGNGTSGMIGDSTKVNRNFPTLIKGDIPFQSVTTKSRHTCGITFLGRGYCRGQNQRGQLGDQTTNESLVPLLIKGYTF